tara:strand:+ start:210 stop:401 length:192 start_codon:yes stop_codon:yes gene_type:complete
MKEFKVGDLVKTRDIRKFAGVIIKKLPEVSYGEPIYQVIWQNHEIRESYETHQNLEKFNEQKT